ncbi:hypothetical protein ACXNSR_38700 [Streptomyces sp. NC-S4]
MEYDQTTAVYLSSIKTWTEYTIAKTDPDPSASFKDLLLPVGGTTKAELLSLSRHDEHVGAAAVGPRLADLQRHHGHRGSDRGPAPPPAGP